ncbi:MAG: SAM-dependent chlorinase/fluorinase [Bacteroidales bacterium]|nr:SAM-dependent chlorinase/fluorinase [Bacteroidales bacterium]MDD4384209.1 SAM-dependent chlorinase/fluorinase [Bacteroidales bacterium]MDY0197520.1 SAM-dependent chlorinase/fluorinase [Tenuifilaceae bacterium]
MDENKLAKQIITLTTDWGQHDYYCGVLKGNIYSACPDVQIVDLSHDIPSFNINNAAFVVRHSYSSFPKGTIHLILVNSDSAQFATILAFKHDEHIFIVPDNGIVGLLFSKPPESIYAIEKEALGSFTSVHLFVQAVKDIYEGKGLEGIGKKVDEYEQRIALRATIDESVISGSIIYIDSYKNAITNISRNLFDRVGQNRAYNIFVESNHNKVSRLSINYNEVDPGELLALFNSANLLEIAIRNGFASELLSLRVGGTVRVNFG